MSNEEREIRRRMRVLEDAHRSGNTRRTRRYFGVPRFKPRTPQLNSKVERSHRTDKQVFYQLLSYKDDVDLEHKLAEWKTSTTTIAPTALSPGKFPYEALGEKLP